MAALALLAGLALLIIGAEILVRGASALALRWGISPLVVGLTVVAFGTSSPEVAVSVQAAWAGSADLAVGNVVGSNIFNLLVILGLAALVAPLSVGADLVRRDIPVMIFASLLTVGLVLDGSLARWEAIVLVLLLGAYLAWLIRAARRAPSDTTDLAEEVPGLPISSRPVSMWRSSLMVVAGLVTLVLGSNWLVDGSVAIARALEVSELVIGLTIVAAGTSLPEVATSVVAAFRGQRDIAIGNVVGSNIFNLFAVLGASGLIAQGGLAVAKESLQFDLPIMLGTAIMCWPLCRSRFLLTRGEGLYLLTGYVAFTAALILRSQERADLAALAVIVVWSWLVIGILGGLLFAILQPSSGAAVAGGRRYEP